VSAEPKILTCTNYDVEDRIEWIRKQAAEDAQEYGEDHKLIRMYRRAIDFMLETGWSFRTEVIFDTDDLKKEASNPKAEMTQYINGGATTDGPVSVSIETTPTTISFLRWKKYLGNETLVVNRKNLVASVAGSRYECILKDIDTSANKL